MRYLILVTCTILLFNNSVIYAQTKIKRLNIELLAGPSFPVGKFGSKDYKDTSAGFAKISISANFSFGYQLTDKIEAVLLVGVSKNKQDEEAMGNRNNEPGSNVQTKVNTNSWKSVKLMLGGKYRLL